MTTANNREPREPAFTAAGSLMALVPALTKVFRTVLSLRFPHLTSVPRFRILLRLLETSPLSLKDLADREGVTPPTMSKSVDALVEKGWVTRQVAAGDRRSIEIALSNRGETLIRQVTEDLKLQFAGLLGQWEPRALEKLVEALGLLQQSTLFLPEAVAGLTAAPADEASYG